MRKWALVTGGGTGIGYAISLALAKRGYNLFIVGRRLQTLLEAAGSLALAGTEVLPIACDISDTTQYGKLTAAVSAKAGNLSLLVNNAGMLYTGPFRHSIPVQNRAMLAVNFTAPVALTYQFLPHLQATRGSVVFISSGAALAPLPYFSLYSATKAALSAFAHSLRHEVSSSGVHILVAYPPATATSMTSHMSHSSRWFPLATATQVGATIAQAIEERRTEVNFWSAERVLALIFRWTPALGHWTLSRIANQLLAATDRMHDSSSSQFNSSEFE
jgi:short-subunit dehydrogenase